MKNLMKLASCGNPAKFVWQSNENLKPQDDVITEAPTIENKIENSIQAIKQVIDRIPTKDIPQNLKNEPYIKETELGQFKSRLSFDKNGQQKVVSSQKFEFKDGNKEITIGYDEGDEHMFGKAIYLKVDDDFGLDNFSLKALADGTGNEVRLYMPDDKEEGISVEINGEKLYLSDEQMGKFLDKVNKYTSLLNVKINDYKLKQANKLKEKRLKDIEEIRAQESAEKEKNEKWLESL